MATLPDKVLFDDFDKLIWKASGRTGYAVKPLKAVIAGATRQWESTLAWRTLRLAKRVRTEVQKLRVPGDTTTNLESMVSHTMLRHLCFLRVLHDELSAEAGHSS